MRTATIDRSKPWTAEDFLRLEETNNPCELINGEIVMSPAPKPLHQKVLSNLNDFLKMAAKEIGGEVYFAPIDLFIDNRNVLQPDLLFLTRERLNLVTDRGVEGAPDIIVEVISPSNIITDRNIKKKKYLDFGVKEFWIVDPANKTLEIYTPEKGPDVPVAFLAEEGEVVSTVLKNLKFNFQEIF